MSRKGWGSNSTITFWRKGPKYWANKLRDKVEPFSLQQEVAQLLLFDANSAEAFPFFAEWTGDFGGFGKPIECIHTWEEVGEACKKIGYLTSRAFKTPEESTVNQPAKFPDVQTEQIPEKVFYGHKEVDAGWRAFWKRRGKKVPSIGRHTLDGSIYLLGKEWFG